MRVGSLIAELESLRRNGRSGDECGAMHALTLNEATFGGSVLENAYPAGIHARAVDVGFPNVGRHFRTYRRLELRDGTDTAVHLSGKPTIRPRGSSAVASKCICGNSWPTLRNSLVSWDADLARGSEVFYYFSAGFLPVWRGQPSPR